MKLPKRVNLVGPDDEIAVGGNDGGSGVAVYLSDLILLGQGWVVRQEHAFQVNRLAGSVEKLNPIVALAVLVGSNSIGGTDFVHYHWRCTGSLEALLPNGSEDGLQLCVGIRVELKRAVPADESGAGTVFGEDINGK